MAEINLYIEASYASAAIILFGLVFGVWREAHRVKAEYNRLSENSLSNDT